MVVPVFFITFIKGNVTKQIHYIVPKHMGGTDDPDNIVELTVEEHAEAHRKLY